MKIARPERPPTPLEIARQHVEHTFGPKIAKRVDTFKDGTFYVSPGAWALSLAWLADFGFYLVCVAGGLVAFMGAQPDASNGTVGLAVLGLLIGVPVVYGLFFGNGRGIGALLTGTRLVRFKNGERIGASGWWAMLVRTLLFPPILVAAVFGGDVMSLGSARRISIDDYATRQLHAAGFLRLNAPG